MKYKLCFLFIKVYTYNNFNNLITELLGRKNKVKFNLGYFFIITLKFQFLF